jgi:hypothetical protein
MTVAPISFVYLVRCAVTRAIKIGIARVPKERLTTLQTGCPTPLALVGSIPGGRPEEQELHRLFARKRIQGEWFALDEADVLAILECPVPVAPPQPITVGRARAWRSHSDRREAPSAPDEAASRCAERERMVSALERFSWNRVQAAMSMRMSRRTFYRRLKEYRLIA